jgi:hypothetical protein
MVRFNFRIGSQRAVWLDYLDVHQQRFLSRVCLIEAQKVGGGRMRLKCPCVVANAAPMSAAEMTAD